MDIIKSIKDIGFKITIFSTGRLKRPDEIKRTTAFEDIMRKEKKNGDNKVQLESSTGVGEADNLNVEE